MDKKILDKNFDFANAEQKIYAAWEGAGAFRAQNPLKKLSDAKPYTVMIPPPNITGSLHMGHALNNTLQDIMVRYHRLKNFETHWQPGTDHASIATQQVVEKKLALEQTDRHKLGREKFLQRVWAWKEESGGMITQQLRRLGASPDWQSERFTMDAGLSKAVTKAFVQLYNDGLIYKAKRMVNWDPKMETAISDLEVVPTPVRGKLYYIRYPLVGGGDDITIATTRPETLLGDTAVAVHPDDERYQKFIGKHIKQPITGRELIIIADEMVDRTAGSGALKVTPSSDPNDFKLYQKHKLGIIEIFDKTGHLLASDDIPEKYRGMERFAARKEMVKDLGDALVKVEDITHTVPYGDRGGVPVEYLLTEQWFLRADVLAGPALDVVKSGKVKFIPETWENDYYRWLENIEPWCISRQLWWGHRIPAYYADDGKIFVAADLASAEDLAAAHYGKKTKLTQDNDVLDTWFSAGLWPFSTLGWPDETPMLKKHYPTNLLVTGFDIIFFWVARMVMMGLYFMKEIPFDTVYVHALVRDEKGQKMSKSKGNVIDPLDLINEFGADAVRFSLTALSSPGRDIKLSMERVRGYRNFVTKLWNGARFCGLLLGDEIGAVKVGDEAPTTNNPINGWMVAELARAIKQCEQHLADYRFDYYANELHHLVWHEFCDWYLEMVKPILQDKQRADYQETADTLLFVLRQILIAMHATMPFVSEEIYQHFFASGDKDFLCNQVWPVWQNKYDHGSAHDYVGRFKELVERARSLRTTLQLDEKIILPVTVGGQDSWADSIIALAGLRRVSLEEIKKPENKNIIAIPVQGATFSMGLPNDLDMAKMENLLDKKLAQLDKDVAVTKQKTDNAEFMKRAKEEIKKELLDRLVILQGEQKLLNDAKQVLLRL
ncbi:MAG: valine--tRNA ligase [Hydrotalea sp.]|nr:valine--tRNA ligase [Hydrotalea sp.]